MMSNTEYKTVSPVCIGICAGGAATLALPCHLVTVDIDCTGGDSSSVTS